MQSGRSWLLLGEERYNCYKAHTINRVDRFRIWGGELLADPQCPTVTSPPVGSRMLMAGSGTANTCSRVEVQLILERGCTWHLRTCSTPTCGQRLGAGVNLWIPESNLFILPAAESLGPGASCFRRPLRPAKCPRGTLYVHTWDVGRVPMHSNPRLLPLSPPFPWRPHVLLEEQPRGRSSTQSLGRAVVRGCRGGSSDDHHRGRGNWLSKMGREESLVEAGC